MRTRNNCGLAMIEILIALAIVAVLALTAVPNSLEAQTRAKLSRVKSDMRAVAVAVDSFGLDHGWAPPDGVDFTGMAGGTGWTTYVKNTIGQPPWNFKSITDVPNNWVLIGQIFLTTPEAYLTGFPEDPFGSQYPYSKSFWWENDINRRKFYPDTEGIISGPWDYAYYGGPTVDGHTRWDWVLISCGPDRMTNNLVPLAGQSIPYFTEYDPTNGTISLGDIHRVGVIRTAHE